MLLILAEHIMNSPNGAGGRRPPAPFGEERPEAAPIICSASIKSIGLRYTVLKALATTCFKSIGQLLVLKAVEIKSCPVFVPSNHL